MSSYPQTHSTSLFLRLINRSIPLPPQVWDRRASTTHAQGGFVGHTRGLTSVAAAAEGTPWILTNGKDQCAKVWCTGADQRTYEKFTRSYRIAEFILIFVCVFLSIFIPVYLCFLFGLFYFYCPL